MKYLAALVISLVAFSAQAQQLRVSPASIDFGTISPLGSAPQEVGFVNLSNHPIHIDSVVAYSVYGGEPFFTYVQGGQPILPGDSVMVGASIASEQDIRYQTTAIVYMENGAYGIPLRADVQYAAPFQTTFNLWGDDLLQALRTYCTVNHTNQLSYNQARDEMFMTLDNQRVNGQGAAVNTVECVYTGSQATGYANRTAAQNMGFNTEHTYPQSFFSSNQPMRSDIHHLFVTTGTSNSQRGNLPFGNVTSGITWQQGGSKRASSRFEPRDPQKGPTARAIFYFVTRYQNYGGFLDNTQEQILKQWHADFLPTQAEEDRNEGIRQAQGNLNPYIVHPTYMDRLGSVVNPQAKPSYDSLLVTHAAFDGSDTTQSVFWLHVQNRGTEPVELSAGAVNDPGLVRIDNLEAPQTLNEGEGVNVQITFLKYPGLQVQDTLRFTTNLPQNPEVEVVLTADWTSLPASIGTAPSTDPVVFYPNPTRDLIRINQRVSFVEVRDMQGRSCLINSNTQEVDLGVLPAGIYLVEAVVNGEVYREKIIRQ